MQLEISTSDLAKLATALTKAQEALEHSAPKAYSYPEARARHAAAENVIGEASALIVKVAKGEPTKELGTDVFDRGHKVAFSRVLDCYYRARRDKCSTGMETAILYLLADLETGYMRARAKWPNPELSPTFEQLASAARRIASNDMQASATT